ncbi:S-adenosylmethionine uptake transporter [Roseibium hamelinense]|uniref:S-adenosylmethionine uptake transporter n=1 Tax=Roseibium hamelinense TaxID=150831 RepID=A0A562TGN6_9HYPH|nr:DMT family transporter [Roseibium hamelinense]MTI46040.1 DMT family transporter [Roseibium hamelinense]TWI92769.1 S-adenosylmethionine uptake transporter [Roseibium hamelinense]
MTQLAASAPLSRPAVAIGFVLVGMAAISINDMLIKHLSGAYPLHQMIFTRSAIGLVFTLVLVQLEGGFAILKTKTPGLHLLRGLLIVLANMSFFTALAVVPLADATALFFVAPLLITLLSIPILGEKVGPFRLGAVAVGFVGVVLMLRPWESELDVEGGRLVLLLPVIGALCYALMQVLTRKLGGTTKASALAAYIQTTFLLVSLGFFVVAGDGRFADGFDNASMKFLLREWIWPQGQDIYYFIALGLCAAVVGYSLSQAYRTADAATVAPFEYVGMPFAVFWGWIMFGEWPAPVVLAGIVLILGGGLVVFLRERQKQKRLAISRRAIRR